MAINVEINNTNNENSMSMMRKFTRKVRSSGVLKKSKSLRYNKRNESSFTTKKQALRSLAKKTEIERLIKLGKVQEKRNGY